MIVDLVGLSMRIRMFSPSRDAGNSVVMHGSKAAGLAVNVAPRVGRGGSVAVPAGVLVGVAVGGGVAVGMAA